MQHHPLRQRQFNTWRPSTPPAAQARPNQRRRRRQPAPQTAAAPGTVADAAARLRSSARFRLGDRPALCGHPLHRSSIDYEKTLAEAVKRAVARKPDLAFDLVAVTPRAGTADELAELTNQAHAEAEAVMKSLSALGIGPERVSMMTWTGQPTDVNEIRLYIR
jgi:hypothetical protein